MSDPLSESYSARATPAKTSEIDPRQKFLGWLHFYLEAAERVRPTLDWAWLRVCCIFSPRVLLCLQILSLPRGNQRPKLEEDASQLLKSTSSKVVQLFYSSFHSYPSPHQPRPPPEVLTFVHWDFLLPSQLRLSHCSSSGSSPLASVSHC